MKKGTKWKMKKGEMEGGRPGNRIYEDCKWERQKDNQGNEGIFLSWRMSWVLSDSKDFQMIEISKIHCHHLKLFGDFNH